MSALKGSIRKPSPSFPGNWPLLLASVDQQGNKTFAFYRFAGACDPLVTFRASEVADDYLRRARIFDLSGESA